MSRTTSVLLVALLAATAACSDSNDSPRCKLTGQTVLADRAMAPWPKFRADMANSGRTAVDLAGNDGRERWRYQLANTVSIESSPVVGMGRIFFGSSDGQFTALDHNGLPDTAFIAAFDEDTNIQTAITAAALIGANGNVFLASGDGRVFQTDPTGNLENVASLGGFIAASPNIASDGEVYVGTLAGRFASVCPNGVPRFSLIVAPTLSSAATASGEFCEAFFGDAESQTCPRTFVGGNDGQVAAYDLLGRQRWAFFASTSVVASVAIEERAEEERNRLFVIDAAGRLFTVGLLDGNRLDAAAFTAPGPVTASPAVVAGRDAGATTTLYVADQTGVLTAVAIRTASDGSVAYEPRTVFEAGSPINSSPAVATGGDAPVLVFGADDGAVYAVADVETSCTTGTCSGGPRAGDACRTNSDCVLLWRFATDSPVGASSPAIDGDGTVYIGTQGGTLFAIGGREAATRTPTPSPTPTP